MAVTSPLASPPPPPPRSSLPATQADHGRASGTSLDADRHELQTRLPDFKIGGLMFLAFGALYFVLGYRATISEHIVVFDALDRLARSYQVWHNSPPKLAAIGFVFPPLTTFVFLPFALIKPVATSLIALPLTSAIFASGTIVVLDRTLARCDLNPVLRLPLLLGFGLNPLWLFYAGNGMSEVVYSFLLAVSLYFFIAWYSTTEPRYLIGAGFAIAVLVLVRYAFVVWAVLLAVLIAVALVRRRASKVEAEGSVIAFAAPVVYVLALWILFNALIVSDPFGWLTSTTDSTQAVNATGLSTAQNLGFDQIAKRLLQLTVAVFPLAFLAVPALVASFVSQRNDMGLWLASFTVLGIVIMGVHAATADRESLLTLRDAFPMYLAAFVGSAWAFRSLSGARIGIWLVTLALLILGFFTAWHGMKTYPFQSQEDAYTRGLFSGKDQEGLASRGGFRAGIAIEARMAQYIKTEIPQKKNSILTDNAQTFGVILLTGRPQNFFDRIDKGDARFRQVLNAPNGKVEYMLLTTNRTSGDIIRQKYPLANEGQQAGLQVVFRTARYILLKVTGPTTTPRTGAAARPTATTARPSS